MGGGGGGEGVGWVGRGGGRVASRRPGALSPPRDGAHSDRAHTAPRPGRRERACWRPFMSSIAARALGTAARTWRGGQEPVREGLSSSRSRVSGRRQPGGADGVAASGALPLSSRIPRHVDAACRRTRAPGLRPAPRDLDGRRRGRRSPRARAFSRARRGGHPAGDHDPARLCAAGGWIVKGGWGVGGWRARVVPMPDPSRFAGRPCRRRARAPDPGRGGRALLVAGGRR